MLGGIDMTKEELMRKAIELSVQNVAEEEDRLAQLLLKMVRLLRWE